VTFVGFETFFFTDCLLSTQFGSLFFTLVKFNSHNGYKLAYEHLLISAFENETELNPQRLGGH